MPDNRIGRPGVTPPIPSPADTRGKSTPSVAPPLMPPARSADRLVEPRDGSQVGRALGVPGAAPVSVSGKLPLLPIDPREPCRPDELMVAHYNVENLFDTVDDPVTNDQQFTAAGPTKYDEAQLELHIQNLSRVIREMNGGRGPDVLAMTEVENAAVVEKLRTEGLADLGYRPVAHVEDSDARGIEPALLTRYPVLGAPKLHPVVNEAGKKFRGILQVDLDVNGRTLTVLVNHWPASRVGQDPQKVAADRTATAKAVKAAIDGILEKDPGREVVVLGDFNEGMGEAGIRDGLRKASSATQALEERRVFDTLDALAEQKAAAGPEGERVQLGTHFYVPEKKWNSFDHLIVSHTLLDGEGLAWVPGSTSVLAPDWLRDPATGGPRRFFLPRIGDQPAHVDPEGASDHFPVAMRLRKVGEQRRPVE
ncbi:MAG: endonuclease/exonuclease/phosphatase family protein [Myxococcales bacterium]|nr:endonuclease/exonuclease/phosphatase family protein [Myxococcales bacterium]